MSEPFSALVSGLSASKWRLLGVLACEEQLTASQLERLDSSTELASWALDSVGQGLLCDGGIVYGMPYTRSFAGERTVAVVSEHRSSVLRHLANERQLARARDDGRTLLGAHSHAGFMAALYAGDLAELAEQSAALRSRSGRADDGLQKERLREAVLCPFDASWLMRTWGDGAWRLIEQVLLDAGVALSPVEELYRFALSQVGHGASVRAMRLLAEQAWLRGDESGLALVTPALPEAEQPALRAAQALLLGEATKARELLARLEAGTGSQKPGAPWSASTAVLLSLLALGQAPEQSTLLVKRVLHRFAQPETAPLAGWPTANLSLPVGRAIRSLLKRMLQPDADRGRLSPHLHPALAPAWETMLLALMVQLDDSDAVTRQGWTRRLILDARRWHDHGYLWIARQALHLGKMLSPEGEKELAELTPCRSGELMLAYLLEREPDWRRALRALSRLTESVERGDAVVARRVSWFLDMASGEFAKPALEEYRSGTGWTQGRRVDAATLRSVKSELPPEDLAVLTELEKAPHLGQFPREALEALCGHPRVFNGARGRQPVEVVRGHGRLETRQERGHLVIQVEPAGAEEGVHVAVENESRVVVYRIDATLARLGKLIPLGLRIPESQKGEGLAVLSRLAPHVEIHSPELGALGAVAADSTPCLRFSPEAGAWGLEIGVRPFGELGRFFPPGLGRSSVVVHSEEDVFETTRNLGEETTRFHGLVNQCPTLLSAFLRETQHPHRDTEHPHGVSLDEDELFSVLSELKQLGSVCNLEWKNTRAISCSGKITLHNLEGSLRRVKGWYLVNGSVKLDAVTPAALGDLLRMPFTKSGRFLRLPTGDFVEIERRISQVLSRLARVAQLPARTSRGELRVPDTAFDVLRELVDTESRVAIEPSAAEWLSRWDRAHAMDPPLPSGLRASLRPYQHEGYRWLWRHSQLGVGVCLADDMGLGKTLQVIALLLTRAKDGPALVVAPTSVCSNWLDELRHFAPGLTAFEYTGRARTELLVSFQTTNEEPRPDVLIVSYSRLQQDSAELASIEWNTAVLDEAQFIKNPHSLRARAAFGLRARQRVAMTGTPIENHLGDLWSIFHFLNPSLLGSLRHFQLCFLKPIEKDRDSAQQTLLKTLVSPFLLRRCKDEVLVDLPPLTTLCHEVRLSDDENLRYALLRRQIHDKLRTPAGKREHKLQVLAEITRLRRFCCHPRLVFPDAPLESAKMQTLLDLVEELSAGGHRALVFSQFVDFLSLVREQLDERGYSYVYLDGSTPKEARHARVQSFQAGDGELFLISLKAGGFGLNLTGADYVIHLDPWWNPAVEAQATDRAHRIGQTRPVTVYRLVTKDTIEERIVELHREKRDVADALLDDTGQSGALGSEELMSLLGLA